MKVLVLTFYYQPDLCAGSFRAAPFVQALAKVLPLGSTIDVVTTLPNRYRSFSVTAPAQERDGRISITRIEVPAHRSGMADQSLAFLAFARGTAHQLRGRRYDVVFATSSRLMTAVLGAWAARRSGARLYLDIRDIFVDTIKDVAPRPIAHLTAPVFSLLERWAVGRADRVNLVSRGFASYFSRRYPRQHFSFYTNGIDEEFNSPLMGSPSVPAEQSLRPLTVLYAGNIGDGQGLHAILPALGARMQERVRFQVIGDGGRRSALADALAAKGVSNVELLEPMSRAELLSRYHAADVLFLHLNDHEAFTKVLPSKIFEYAALGKPVWAGVSGYAAEFLRSEVTNAAVFPPCDAEAAIRAFEELTLGDTPRPEFVARYSRESISRGLAMDLLATVSGP